MRLGDLDSLKEDFIETINAQGFMTTEEIISKIDNVPTADTTEQEKFAYDEGYAHGLETKRQQGEWIDYSEEGYVECPFCEHLTTCEDNIDELHYCWNCGAYMQKGGSNG